MEIHIKNYKMEFLGFCLALVCIAVFLGFSYHMPARINPVQRYTLKHSDTAYTYTATRGEGMTIINYYDKDKK